MEQINEILPSILARLPEPSSDKLESQTPEWEPPKSSKPEAKLPLESKWQKKWLNMEALPGVQMAASAVEQWCGRVHRNKSSGRAVVLSGRFGCGKTRMLRAARRYVQAIYMDAWPAHWPHSINVQSVEFPRFCYEVEKGNQDHFDDVAGADVAFIDDVGAEEDRFKSGAPTRILGDLLGQLESRFTFITTNIDPAKWRERWDGRVEDRLLRRNSVVVNLWEVGAKSFAEAQIGL